MPYNKSVRRLLAIAIVFILGLPALTPLLALNGAADSTTPICCRRDGKHHCAGMAGISAASPSSQTQVIRAALTNRCPYGSNLLPAAPRLDWFPSTPAAGFAGFNSHPSIAPQTGSKRRIAADRSRQKRGPPSAAFSA